MCVNICIDVYNCPYCLCMPVYCIQYLYIHSLYQPQGYLLQLSCDMPLPPGCCLYCQRTWYDASMNETGAGTGAGCFNPFQEYESAMNKQLWVGKKAPPFRGHTKLGRSQFWRSSGVEPKIGMWPTVTEKKQWEELPTEKCGEKD